MFKWLHGGIKIRALNQRLAHGSKTGSSCSIESHPKERLSFLDYSGSVVLAVSSARSH
jgi:hypothetical protein